MLHDEVIDAVKKGKFHIYAVSNIEEGIELLTEKKIKIIDAAVNKRLKFLAEKAQESKQKRKKK